MPVKTNTEWLDICDELFDTKDKKELSMRVAYAIVQKDKYFAVPSTDYDIEVIVDPITGDKKLRVVIECNA
ncbi:hypothetical protein SJ954_01735 [Enterococcus faecium]